MIVRLIECGWLLFVHAKAFEEIVFRIYLTFAHKIINASNHRIKNETLGAIVVLFSLSHFDV